MNSADIIRVISIGYERRNIDEFLEILTFHSVTKLLDIRERPLSRKKGFSKKSLASSLESVGIEYCHLREAGNPYHRDKHTDLEECLARYREYLQAHLEIADLVAAKMNHDTNAVLCYERQHSDCHRSILLEAVRQRGYLFELIEVKS